MKAAMREAMKAREQQAEAPVGQQERQQVAAP
jgi:hypothetical protein